MDRKLYQLTETQAAGRTTVTLPSDAEIKAMAAKSRKPWGLIKRDLALKAVRGTRDYVAGLWQGRVDAARGTGYSDERFSEHYNLGYHDGYLNYQSDRRGWHPTIREQFDTLYLN